MIPNVWKFFFTMRVQGAYGKTIFRIFTKSRTHDMIFKKKAFSQEGRELKSRVYRIRCIFLAVLFLAVLFVSACSSDDTSSESNANNNEGTNDEEERELADEQVIDLTSGEQIRTLDVSKATEETGIEIISRINSGLMIYEDEELIPDVAEDMPEANDDNTEYTYTIREDAEWSDGSPVTADDFVYSWRRALHPDIESQYTYIFESAHIKNAEEIVDEDSDMYGDVEKLGVEAEDDSTLVVTLSEPTPEEYFNSMMEFTPFFPLKEEFAEEQGDDYAQEPENLLYNGAYKLDEWNHGSSWKLVKNDDYWDADNVTIDEVNYKVVKETTTSLKLYEDGEIDRTGLVAEDVDQYQDDDEYKEIPDTGVFYWDFNRDKVPEFKNKKLRQAFFHALDRESLVDVVLNNVSIPANYVVPQDFVSGPNDEGFHAEDGIADLESYPDTDKEKAEELWEEAKDELDIEELEVEMMTTDGELPGVIVDYYAEQLSDTLDGLEITINKQPYSSYVDQKSSGEIELGVGEGWWPDYEDPMAFLELFTTDNPQNTFGLSDEKYDDMIAEAESLGDEPEKRWEALQEAEKYLIEEAHIVPAYQEGSAILSKDNLDGVVDQPNGISMFYRHAKVYEPE